MPADDPLLPETRLIVATQPGVESLIVNGGFDGELAPWLCGEGRVIQDPSDDKNWLLEVTPPGGRFRLTQIFFKPPARKAPMTLSFRAMISEEAALSGFDLILIGHDEKPLAQTFVAAGTPGEWKKIEWKGSMPIAPAALSIGRRDEGVVWIDDVRLEPSTIAPEAPQGQPSP